MIWEKEICVPSSRLHRTALGVGPNCYTPRTDKPMVEVLCNVFSRPFIHKTCTLLNQLQCMKPLIHLDSVPQNNQVDQTGESSNTHSAPYTHSYSLHESPFSPAHILPPLHSITSLISFHLKTESMSPLTKPKRKQAWIKSILNKYPLQNCFYNGLAYLFLFTRYRRASHRVPSHTWCTQKGVVCVFVVTV